MRYVKTLSPLAERKANQFQAQMVAEMHSEETNTFIGVHGSGCCGPCYRNVFGVGYCSWCGVVFSPATTVKRVVARGGAK